MARFAGVSGKGSIIYKQKRVEVFYTFEENSFITITVYVFYGKWES
jgi:hypothetical protein